MDIAWIERYGIIVYGEHCVQAGKCVDYIVDGEVYHEDRTLETDYQDNDDYVSYTADSMIELQRWAFDLEKSDNRYSREIGRELLEFIDFIGE